MSDKLSLLKEYGALAGWSKHQIVSFSPHADESEKLRQADMTIDDCVRSDLNWLYNERIFFVSIWSYHSPHTYAFNGVVLDATNADQIHGGALNVRTDAFPLYTHTVETILDRLASWVDHNPDKLEEVYQMPEDPESYRKYSKIIDDIDKFSL